MDENLKRGLPILLDSFGRNLKSWQRWRRQRCYPTNVGEGEVQYKLLL
jgi:hypothetical protein